MPDRQGYKRLVVWKNAQELRRLVYQMTSSFTKTEMKRVSQMRDAARSVKQNIQEGYKRGSLGEYIRALAIAQGSLGELMGDIEDCQEDSLIGDEDYQKLDALAGKTDYLFKRLIQALRKKQASLRHSDTST